MNNDSVDTPFVRQEFPKKHRWTNRETVFSMWSLRKLRDATIEELVEVVFSMLSVPGCYKHDKSRV
jgi:hypothetical protein